MNYDTQVNEKMMKERCAKVVKKIGLNALFIPYVLKSCDFGPL